MKKNEVTKLDKIVYFCEMGYNENEQAFLMTCELGTFIMLSKTKEEAIKEATDNFYAQGISLIFKEPKLIRKCRYCGTENPSDNHVLHHF